MTTQNQMIYGLHAVQAVLRCRPEAMLRLWVQAGRRDTRMQRVLEMAQAAGIAIVTSERQDLTDLVHSAAHQGVVAECQAMPSFTEAHLPHLLADLVEAPFLLILDGVQDPHNLGACLRTANAAGVHVVIAPKDRAVGLTPVVRKVACGAAELTPFVPVTNIARCMRWLKKEGVWLYGLTDDADDGLFTADFNGPLALVCGAEGKGLRRLTRESCDALLKIPMCGNVSSLNVSVAAGVGLFEVVRQRAFLG